MSAFHKEGKFFKTDAYAFNDAFFAITMYWSTDDCQCIDYKFVELEKKTKTIEVTNWIVKESGNVFA